jgi:adenine-specific DNA methylase
MLKRLIEVALPLKEVSEQASKEKYIQSGNVSTLHIWWARRPLAACRAVVFASLIPDPDDPECPEGFRELVMETLDRNDFAPRNGGGSPIPDTPRNRCLEFIKHLVQWENSNNSEYVFPARKLVAAAHKFLHPEAEADTPKVLDPFAGGAAIPLEALRLGCEAHALDLNPVAHLIEVCTLIYPQKYGQADSRPVPDYIARLVAQNRKSKKQKGKDRPLLDETQHESELAINLDEIVPDVDITEAEYRKNPLATDVKYWGNWVAALARRELQALYPFDPNGSVPVAYLWARAIKCPNPACQAVVPLIRQTWLRKKSGKEVAIRLHPAERSLELQLCEGELDFDPSQGTVRNAKAVCRCCGHVADAKYVRNESRGGRMTHRLMAVVTTHPKSKGRFYREPSDADGRRLASAEALLREMESETVNGVSLLPNESISKTEPRRISPPLYGLERWRDIFNPVQLAALAVFVKAIHAAHSLLVSHSDPDYARAVTSYMALGLDRGADHWSALCTWNPNSEKLQHTYTRQALPMVWDYAEANVFGGSVGDWKKSIIENEVNGIVGASSIAMESAVVSQGSATQVPYENGCFSAVITDPPYYDAVPYSDLSDLFYIWLKRTVGRQFPEKFSTPLTPKAKEIVEQRSHTSLKSRKDAHFYENNMALAFCEARRVLSDEGVIAVMFAHKSTTAWETLICALLSSGLTVSASWPIDTESKTRMGAQGTASLASSVTMVCRKRPNNSPVGLWDEVRIELKEVAQERLAFFWSQGIRGADFFISAIGPALSVFGKYERVTKLSGEEVTVGQFLDEVRGLVTNYALTKIMKTTQTGNIDAESQFYVIWRWSYADAKVPAGESFMLSQALGLPTELMWDRTGTLEKSGENVQAMPIAKRMKIKDLGEPVGHASSLSPSHRPEAGATGLPSLIDVLHRLCVFREKNDPDGMGQFLARSGQGSNSALWVVAQAISDILPDGDKEKQLMQGLLNQKEKLEQAAEQGRLF